MSEGQEEERHLQPGGIRKGSQKGGALSGEEEPEFPVDPGSESREEGTVHSDTVEGKWLSLVGAHSLMGQEGS